FKFHEKMRWSSGTCSIASTSARLRMGRSYCSRGGAGMGIDLSVAPQGGQRRAGRAASTAQRERCAFLSTLRRSAKSLRLDAGGLDDRAEALDAIADERAERVRRAADHGVAIVLHLGTHVGAVERLDDLGIETGDDLGRQAGRPQEAEPSGRLAKGRK